MKKKINKAIGKVNRVIGNNILYHFTKVRTHLIKSKIFSAKTYKVNKKYLLIKKKLRVRKSTTIGWKTDLLLEILNFRLFKYISNFNKRFSKKKIIAGKSVLGILKKIKKYSGDNMHKNPKYSLGRRISPKLRLNKARPHLPLSRKLINRQVGLLLIMITAVKILYGEDLKNKSTGYYQGFSSYLFKKENSSKSQSFLILALKISVLGFYKKKIKLSDLKTYKFILFTTKLSNINKKIRKNFISKNLLSSINNKSYNSLHNQKYNLNAVLKPQIQLSVLHENQSWLLINKNHHAWLQTHNFAGVIHKAEKYLTNMIYIQVVRRSRNMFLCANTFSGKTLLQRSVGCIMGKSEKGSFRRGVKNSYKVCEHFINVLKSKKQQIKDCTFDEKNVSVKGVVIISKKTQRFFRLQPLIRKLTIALKKQLKLPTEYVTWLGKKPYGGVKLKKPKSKRKRRIYKPSLFIRDKQYR